MITLIEGFGYKGYHGPFVLSGSYDRREKLAEAAVWKLKT